MEDQKNSKKNKIIYAAIIAAFVIIIIFFTCLAMEALRISNTIPAKEATKSEVSAKQLMVKATQAMNNIDLVSAKKYLNEAIQKYEADGDKEGVASASGMLYVLEHP